MNSAQRVTISVRAKVRSFTAKPFLLVLFLLMPIVSIQLYGLSVGGIADFGLFDTEVPLRLIGKITGAIFVTSTLAGILGLFQSLSVQRADSRLVVSGYHRLELAAARFVTIVFAALIVAVVTTISLKWSIGGHLASAAITLAGLFVAGVLYGALGVLIGSVLPRSLEGSLVLVALADVSAIVASGLFPISDSLTHLFPLSHIHDIVLQAVVEGSTATTHVLPVLGYLLVVILFAVFAYVQALSAGGDTV
ncbi:hypothetical protein [Halorubrum aethiopicum]|uniref:hypothetical protein n=1 Tax=Halorubrum aethiopicum TaxID=1758255 RepID=UPI00082D76BF|nr:hypothetical protein [Halorubrum aethiopicum]